MLNISNKKTTFFLPLILIGLVAIIFYQVIHFELVWDDSFYLLQLSNHKNPNFIADALTKPFFLSDNYYRPITTLWIYAEAYFSNTDPQILHATNLIIHCLNTFLIYLIVKKIVLHFQVDNNRALYLIILTTLAFGLNPIVIESVAWVSGRFDLLLTLFLLLALLIDRSTIKNSNLKAILVGLCFFFAALNKEMAIVFPLVFPLWHYLINNVNLKPTKESVRKFINSYEFKSYLFIFIFGLLYLAIRYIALGYLYLSGVQTTASSSFDFQEKVIFVSETIGVYSKMLLFPFIDLSPVHPIPESINLSSPLGWGVILAILALLVLFVLKKINSKLIALAAIFLLSLFPVLNILPVGIVDNIAHERFMLFPLAITLLSFSIIIIRVLKNISPKFTLFITFITAFWVFTNVLNTITTLPLWKNNMALWSWAYAKHPTSQVATINFASQINLDNNPLLALEVLERNKEKHLSAAFLIMEGEVYLRLNQFQKAEDTFLKALEYPISKFHYGITLSQILFSQLQQGKLDDIEYLLKTTKEILPKNFQPYLNEFYYYQILENPDQAIKSIDKALLYAAGTTKQNISNLRLEYLKQSNKHDE